MINNTITTAQMELSFETGVVRHARSVRPARPSTARWWFNRMRQVVDAALDRQPAPRPRPEQTYFRNSYRAALAGN